MDSTPVAYPSRTWLVPLSIVEAVIALTVMGTAQIYVASVIYRAGWVAATTDGLRPVVVTTGLAFAMASGGAGLAGLVFYAGTRVWRTASAWQPSGMGQAAIYATLCVLFTMTHLGGMSIAFVLTNDDYGPSELPLVFSVNLRNLWAFEVVIFLLMVGVYWVVRYARQARERELVAAELATKLAESRLEALRAQLNPHFLFNSLNAVSSLALKGDTVGVTEAIGRLSALLRTALNQREGEVPLARELAFLDDYMAIHTLRFPDRLAIDKSVAPETTNALVPALILQPIVENAVKHGVTRSAGKQRISLTARRDNGKLYLEIQDSGPGFPPVHTGNGLGLANTRERLEQLYGRSHHFEIVNGPQGGSSVRLTIPFVISHGSPAA